MINGFTRCAENNLIVCRYICVVTDSCTVGIVSAIERAISDLYQVSGFTRQLRYALYDSASKCSDLPPNQLRMHARDSAINTLSVLTNRSTDHRTSDDLLPERVRKIRDLEKGEDVF